jgi:hypothetical protein
LQIIFGLHAVAGELGVARHALVFLEELGGVAALAIVLAIATTGLSTEIRAPLSSATAPAATLTIIDQMLTSLKSRSFPAFAGMSGQRDSSRGA